MKINLNPLSAIRDLRTKAAAKKNRALMLTNSPLLKDESGAEFFTMLDGEPVTFDQFNAKMERLFAEQQVRDNHIHFGAYPAK